MNVVVRYLAQLRQIAGRSDERVQLDDDCTVGQFLTRLAGREERLRRALLDDAGAIQRTVLVFVNDEQAGAERPLIDGDEITLMTPIAGGA